MNALAGNLCSAAAQLVIDVGYRQNNHGAADRRWFTTNNLAVAADGFRALGGFDPSYRTAEDRDFCSRWAESGRRLAYEPAAVVEHRNALGLFGFARLHFAYGRGAYRFHRDRRRARDAGEDRGLVLLAARARAVSPRALGARGYAARAPRALAPLEHRGVRLGRSALDAAAPSVSEPSAPTSFI